MKEHIVSINLTHEPGAIAYLNQPQPCTRCEGTGSFVRSWEPEPGVIMATIDRCPDCAGSGVMVYISWS